MAQKTLALAGGRHIEVGLAASTKGMAASKPTLSVEGESLNRLAEHGGR